MATAGKGCSPRFLSFLWSSRWSGFLLCALAMLLVIFPMFGFPKKLPPRHKKKKRRKKLSLDDMSSDDDVLKEKSNKKSQPVSSSMGFGKDIKGQRGLLHHRLFGWGHRILSIEM